MSARVRKTAPPKPAEAKPAKKRWKVHVNASVGDLTSANDATAANPQPHIGVADLELAALDPAPLPWRSELERHFEQPLPYLTAYQGPDVDAALAHDNAAAAVKGDAVLLPQNADKPLIAHEIAHILQQGSNADTPNPAQAEIEAYRAEQQVARGEPVQGTATTLPVGSVALRSNDALEEQDLVQGSDREAAAQFAQATTSAQPDETAQPAENTETTEGSGDVLGDVSAGEALPADPVPTFEVPPMPEIAVDEDAAEAAQADAEAALSGADEADGLVTAFKDAPPSVKALHHDQLDGQIGDMAEQDQAAFEADMPAFTAEMSGTDDLAAPQAVQTPEARDAQLEDGTPAPAPEPQVDPTPDPGTPDLNAAIDAFLASFFSSGDADSLGQTFHRVSTSDEDVDTGAGARPDVPLEGETDPQRVDDQDTVARDDARNSRMEATQAVTDGPGPEQVTLQELREDFIMDARETPTIDQAEEPVEGAADFRDKALDGEVTALFDAHHNDAMATSLEEAETEMSSAVNTRDTERDTAVAEAEAERTRLNEAADTSQRDQVSDRRQEVQDARQTAVDGQQAHVDDMETQADLDRQTAENTIETEVSEAETQVETDFTKAENDAQAEVDEGERDAEAERARQERESENQSWWDRASSWVADQFDKLTKFINDVFDAVRAAVKDIIDKVKEAAIALIDKAVSAITSAIEKLGEALKSAVNGLLAEHFPQLATALNEAIDGAVTAATEFVEAVGEGLETAVTAMLDALAAGIDAILAAYQAAVNAALAIARAALTGDWDALAKLILEPILYALGIEPAAFYQMIERAMEALDVIIDDPIGFLSNLIDSVVGGIRQFGGNIVTHLQAGIIGWLTGALGGDIQIPERFDLMGVLDLARQILGLTVDMIRRVAVRVLGEEAVERIEFVMGYVVELVTGGFSALWDRIMADLSSLKDLVLDGIKSFLMERIVMAAIAWLASMFSPVGALIKLVMTIWNFMMFLKDQLARIMQVVQTVVNTMWEIATGVLQPAIDGVEGVLGRLLPIVIDLFARLLGLGNVAGRVREIIGDVRQRIEDALVNLINRVLSAFTGGRMGGGGAADSDEPAVSDGQLMTPIPVRGGGENHTLHIEDQGETVVPMIHSTPQTLESWLDSQAGTPFENLSSERNWRGAVKTNKKTELESLVTRAKEEEAQLDRAAEAAEDAQNADPATATDEVQATQTEGEQTKRALEEVLEFFGVDPDQSLADFFDEAIKAEYGESADIRRRLRSTVLNQVDKPRYMTMDWAEAKAQLPTDGALPGTWKSPASSNAILIALHKNTFEARVKEIVIAHVASLTSDTYDAQKDNFFSRYLAADLNQGAAAQAIIRAILNKEDGTAIANAQQTVIQETADRKFSNQLEWDYKFNDVTGQFYKNTLVPNADTILSGSNFGPYFEDDAENTAGDGSRQPKPLIFFLADGDSKRASKNRQRLADSVRGANTGQHEWVASRLAAQALLGAAREVETTGDTAALKGATEVLEFQHNVRTPTMDLIFRPGGSYPSSEHIVTYQARGHRESDDHSDTPMGQLPANLRNEWYPTGTPRQGDRIGVLQGHPGAVYAYARSGTLVPAITQQIVGHHEWDQALAGQVTEKIGDVVYFRDVEDMGKNILQFYTQSIWAGSNDPSASGGQQLPLYFRSRSESSGVSYANLKSDFSAQFRPVFETLEQQINGVINR